MPVEIINPVNKLTIPARYRDTIKLLFIAKHALGDGSRDKVDGDHAVYHREVRDVLEWMGLNVSAANSPEYCSRSRTWILSSRCSIAAAI